MSDSVSVTSSQSWFGRIGAAFAGVIIGLIFFLGSFVLLTWNEGRAIHRAQALEAGSKSVISVPASPVDAANEGKLIHVTGDMKTTGPVADSEFGISAAAIVLKRNVEMYQWTESKKSETKTKLGGGEETMTTYTYDKDWSAAEIDSGDFHDPKGHENPGAFPVQTKAFAADPVTVGDFTLSSSLIDDLTDYEPLPVKGSTESEVTFTSSEPIQVVNNAFYVGKDPKQPAVGDLKISFEIIKPGPVSIVSGQVKNTFEPYSIGGQSIELLQTGTFSAESMFQSAQQENVVFTWILRLAGFVIMFIGLGLITQPLKVFADVIPFLGSIVGAGLGFVALALAVPLTLCTIAVAWLAYRPLIGVPLVILAFVSIFFGVKALRAKRALKPATA